MIPRRIAYVVRCPACDRIFEPEPIQIEDRGVDRWAWLLPQHRCADHIGDDSSRGGRE